MLPSKNNMYDLHSQLTSEDTYLYITAHINLRGDFFIVLTFSNHIANAS